MDEIHDTTSSHGAVAGKQAVITVRITGDPVGIGSGLGLGYDDVEALAAAIGDLVDGLSRLAAGPEGRDHLPTVSLAFDGLAEEVAIWLRCRDPGGWTAEVDTDWGHGGVAEPDGPFLHWRAALAWGVAYVAAHWFEIAFYNFTRLAWVDPVFADLAAGCVGERIGTLGAAYAATGREGTPR